MPPSDLVHHEVEFCMVPTSFCVKQLFLNLLWCSFAYRFKATAAPANKAAPPMAAVLIGAAARPE